ncbi:MULTISPECIES: DMT family transporter [Sphingobacterium]|uniref:EamA family transporter n=1 Tax=Sphingobacterium multivorum TaxID=28454 RepID=A0A654E072_SPHMU|nr:MULTISPECIES: DMT family transporter [Sphingobacterium]QQT60701.1 DMT family transporter [Sphingobacterium multivorum]VXD08251.1 EamA family transporter [Sphingobacterium multivorum]HAL52967.1 EamA family transporter [Sphingobacterium sp.]
MKKSYLVLHTAVLLAGFTGVFGKLITLNQIPLVWFRVLLSTLILFVVLKLFKIERLKSTKDILNIARGGLLLTIHWIFFYGSIKFSNISIGVVCYCLTSFFTAILEPIINKKRFSAAQLMLSMLTLIGISLIFHFDSSYQVGIILGVISTIFAALYTIYNERLVKQYDSKLLNYYQMLSGTIVLGLGLPIFYYLFPTERFIPSFSDGIYLILLSLFCTVGLYVLFAESLKKLSAFTVNLSFNLEPIYSIIIAFLFFNEGKQVNASFYVGLAFVLVSVLLQTLRSIRNKT